MFTAQRKELEEFFSLVLIRLYFLSEADRNQAVQAIFQAQPALWAIARGEVEASRSGITLHRLRPKRPSCLGPTPPPINYQQHRSSEIARLLFRRWLEQLDGAGTTCLLKLSTINFLENLIKGKVMVEEWWSATDPAAGLFFNRSPVRGRERLS